MILVNHDLSTNNWDNLSIMSYDVMGVRIHGTYGAISVLNIYNDCANNKSLVVVEEFMRRREERARMGSRRRERAIWAGNFNRHHPLWDEERNAHLFTRTALEATQPLLDMINKYDMRMTLPKDIPTLEACTTKNFMRTDNVFCTAELYDLFESCNTYPHWRPLKTDHMPIISVLGIEPERILHVDKYNFKLTDWEEFKRTLANELADMQSGDELTSEEKFFEQINKLDAAINVAIKEHVPVMRSSPYMKRWWTKELTDMKKSKERLARKSYRKIAVDEDPIHEEFRQVRNDYSLAIRRTKQGHWTEWLETLDDEGLWAANRLVSGPATDGGRSRIPMLKEARTNTEKGQLYTRLSFLKERPLRR